MTIARRKKISIGKKSKIAFVCSGGAAKAGAYHLGVALALREKGFQFVGGLIDEGTSSARIEGTAGDRQISVYVGSSAGSIICSFLAAGYSLDSIFDSFLRKGPQVHNNEKPLTPLTYQKLFSLKRDAGIFAPIYNLLDKSAEQKGFSSFMAGMARESYKSLVLMGWTKMPGFFSTAGIERYLREDVLPSNDFAQYKAELFLVTTQLNHSRKVIFSKHNDLHAIEDKSCLYYNDVPISQAAAASTALPPIFSPYPITMGTGKKVYYFDGEIRDTLSTHVAIDAGADLVITSYTHQPYHFKRDIGSLHEYGIPTVVIQMIYLIIERKIQQYRTFIDHSRATYDALAEALIETNIPDGKRKAILEMFESKMNFKRGVDYIHIHPRAHDNEMFFGDHFSLKPNTLKETVRTGFRNAIDVLRAYEFE